MSENDSAGDEGAKTRTSEPPASGSSGAGEGAPVSGEVASSEPKAPSNPPVAEVAPDPLEVAKAEAQKFRDQLLRTAADFDNFRKRSRREAEDAQRRGKENVLKELLPVFDNLERAATSAVTAADAKSVAEGIRMVLRQFASTLDRIGIQRVETVGKPFDPGLHEAIQHIDSTEHEAGTVAAEVQAGYQMGDHLVRAALVVVSKGPGPEKAEAAEPKPEEAGSSPPPAGDAPS